MITLTDISFAYHRDGPLVVSDFTASARPGRITAILGPNAAGKSTLLRLALGLLTPQRGLITINDRPLTSISHIERAKRCAYVAQRTRSDIPFTVRQVIELGRFAAGPSRAATDWALEQCELTSLSSALFPELSVGQQQRVAMARALAQIHGAHDPILLLDEPTSAMDLRFIRSIGLHLRALAQTGATILVVMHDLAQVAQLTDDVWLMHQGRCIAAGPTPNVLTADTLSTIYHIPFGPAPNINQLHPLFND